MDSIAIILLSVIKVFTYCVFTAVVISWIIAFWGYPKHPLAHNVIRVIHRITDPVFNPVRAVVPSLGGLDISPIIILLALQGLHRAISQLLVF